MPGEHEFVKHPDESYVIGVDYTNAAPDDAVLASGIWTAYDMSIESDATDDVLFLSAATIEGQVAKVRVLGGILNRNYRLGVTVTFNTTDILHDDIYMFVRQEG